MRRTSLAMILATLAATAIAAQAPITAIQVEGRSTDASASGQTTTAHGVQAINDATAAALIGALETRFAGQEVAFRLGEVRSERVSLRDIALHGTGQIRFENDAAWMPIQFDALYDTATQIVQSPAIVLGGSATAGSAQAFPLESLQSELARRMNAEFSSQAVAFDLDHTSIVGGDGRRVIVNGNGLARFDGEESAPVQIQGIYDRSSKRWIDASYEFTMADDTELVASR
ncbi:MAG: hypothetical protein V4704_10130 [Pseudomonadota bacterium]